MRIWTLDESAGEIGGWNRAVWEHGGCEGFGEPGLDDCARQCVGGGGGRGGCWSGGGGSASGAGFESGEGEAGEGEEGDGEEGEMHREMDEWYGCVVMLGGLLYVWDDRLLRFVCWDCDPARQDCKGLDDIQVEFGLPSLSLAVR